MSGKYLYVRTFLAGILLLPCLACSAHAATQAERAAAANDLVKEALHREIYGLQADRQQLLQEALSLVPNYAPAKWHQGYVFFQNRWVHADEVSQRAVRSRQFISYEQLRGQQPDTVAGHMLLADWCREQDMRDQERAHLTRVLDLDTNHRLARSRLGFRQIDGRWVSNMAMRDARNRRDQQRHALVEWRSKIDELRGQLEQRSEKKQRAAADSIRSIQDPDAIPAMEAVLSERSEAAALLAVEAWGQMPDEDAARALARQSVVSPWLEVRDVAAEQLGQRQPESYVPMLLAGMYSPIESRFQVLPSGRGQLAYQHLFLREGQDERQLLVLNTQYQRVPLPGGDGRGTLTRSLANSVGTAANRERSLMQRNAQTRGMNDRIARTLTIATGQQLPAIPDQWWQWWDDQNDVVQSEKPTRTVQRANQIAMVDQLPPSVQIGDGFPQGVPQTQRQRTECFAAGTLVWTISGLVAIEDVRVGDLVLAQDVETGELAYKPVLRTTLRPQEPLLRIHVGDESFDTTHGHPFWVAGDGWTRARDLKSGMPIHGVAGAVPVSRVEADVQEVETFNLVVADFHTYFVGNGRILSHDVVDRRPTSTVVPGLTDQ